MIGRLLDFSLRQRLLVASAAAVIAAWGLYAAQRIPIDAFPDVTTVQVMVVTQMPGQPPADVERFVTVPVEIHLMGLPGLAEIRSLSKFGLSQITVIFEDDVDVYFARQLVLERLIEVKRRLPANVEPLMMPVSTGLGEVYQYYLAADQDLPDGPARDRRLMDMRTAQDWVIRPLLKGQPGVIEVNSLGGFVKQYQVIVDPDRLRKYNLALHDVFEAVSRNNANVGGNILERHTEQYIVRGVGMIQKLEDIGHIVVKEEAGVPVFVRDLAEIAIGHAVRHGAALVNGREAVAGIVLMLRGANARDVVDGVKERVEAINRTRLLPDGWTIVPFYDRIELVTAALGTMQYALLEGIALLILISLPFLGHLRGAVIVTVVLLLTPLGTFIVMERLGLSANLMSLGGLAIAIGEIADGAIVLVENAHRHLAGAAAASAPRRAVILRAAREVGRPIAFTILIITVVFLPLLTLHGMEGKMFQPLAVTMVIALLVSLVLSLTLAPVLCSWLLDRRDEAEPGVLRRLKAAYLPVLRWALARRRLVAVLAGALCLMSLALVPFLGREFVPIMDEGALTPQIIRHPSVSLPHALELERQVQQALLEFPETRLVVSKIGRSEIANAPEEPNESDPVVTLTPRDRWTTASAKDDLVDAMRQRLAVIPGITLLMSQPIQERVDELISGIRTEIAVKVFGEDLDVLKDTAEQIAEILKGVAGVRDVKMEQLFGQTYLTVTIDRDRIARHGINVADVQQIIATAIGGAAATQVYERERRFDLVLRFPVEARTSVRAISNILIRDPAGTSIPLSDLAAVELREGPALISRERLQRRIAIGFNVVDRDIAGVVAEGRTKIAAQVELPEGYRIAWGGAFENMERATARLAVVVPVTVLLIFLLLFSSMRSLRYAALILVNVPLALVGGVLALWLTGEYLSVPASVGFISLFGIAVGNGIVLISYIHELRQTGAPLSDAIETGCLLRLRPVLMTTLTTLLGLLPLAFAQGIGAEVQRPLAVVVIGGILSSTLLTLVVLPTLFPWFEEPLEASPSPPAGTPPTSEEGAPAAEAVLH